MIPIYKPYLNKTILSHAHQAIDSGWISSIGEYKTKAQKKLEEIYSGCHVLLTNNGTTAGHLMIKALLKKHKIKRFYVPNNVFIAAWNMILYEFNGSFDIIPIDANIDTWNFDYEKCNFIDSEDSCVLLVHNLGNPVNIYALKNKYKKMVFIEDNCEGFFGKYGDKPTGTESLISTLSFFGNKNISCGEGGAVITKDRSLYEYMNYLHGQAQTETRYIHGELGYNYRMTNIQAAILYGQLEHKEEIHEKKSLVFAIYRQHFKNFDNIICQKTDYDCTHSQWMFGVRIPNSHYNKSSKILKDNDIESRQMFFPMSKHPYLTEFGNDEFNSEILNKEVIILPSYPELTRDEIEHVCSIVKTIARII